MRKRILLALFTILLLLNGCTNNTATKEIEASKDFQSSTPLSINGSQIIIDGHYALIDGVNLYDLNNQKLVGSISALTNTNSIGHDIYDGQILCSQDNSMFIYNIENSEKINIMNNVSNQSSAKMWDNYIVWQENRNIEEYPGVWSLYLYDLNTKKKHLLTSTLAVHATFNISDYKVVWEDERNFKGDSILRGGDNVPENNKDIYLYDIKTGNEISIATGPYMECKPDVYGNYVVWEDRNNGSLDADIVLFDIQTKKSVYLTHDKFNQGFPAIYENYIVWMDERNGIATNDVIINGNLPNSDIYIYDIKTKEESLLTGKEPQILPCIGSDWVGWVTSRQVDPVVEIKKYR